MCNTNMSKCSTSAKIFRGIFQLVCTERLCVFLVEFFVIFVSWCARSVHGKFVCIGYVPSVLCLCNSPFFFLSRKCLTFFNYGCECQVDGVRCPGCSDRYAWVRASATDESMKWPHRQVDQEALAKWQGHRDMIHDHPS